MRKIIDKGLELSLIFLMAFLVVDVLWQVLSRYILVSPSSVTDELAGYLLIWVGLLGAETMIAPCLARVQRELGAFAYGVDTPNIETCAAELLLAQHKTIAVADSCTGGLLGDLLTNVPGASAVFAGGIIAYNDETKTRLLDVDPALIARCGAVSSEVAAAMAEHVRAAFGTDLGLSITGLAGPDGDGVHTVGTLFVALATPDGTFHRTLHKDKWGRVRIKHAAANHAFDMLRRYLTSLPVEMEENR